jgi:hypothetical protein
MTIIDLEHALIGYFAEKLEMTVDKTIFRGILNAKVVDAVGIHIESCDPDNFPSIPILTVQILGRYKDRDDALRIAAKINASLPYYSQNLTILKIGSIATYPTSHKGKDVTGVSANLKIKAKTLTC